MKLHSKGVTTKTTLLAALLLASLAVLCAAEPKPNVMLIMADDLRDYGGAFTRS